MSTAFTPPGSFSAPKPMVPPSVAQTVAPTPVQNTNVETEGKKKRTRSTVEVTPDKAKYILENFATADSIETIAKHLGLSTTQVKQQVWEAKNKLREKAKADADKNGTVAYGTREVQERGKTTKVQMPNYEDPKTPFAVKAEDYIKKHWSRPESVRRSNSEAKTFTDNTVNNVLNELGLI